MRGPRAVLVVAIAAGVVGGGASPAHAGFPAPGKAFGYNGISGSTSQDKLVMLDAAVATGATYIRLGVNWAAYQAQTSTARPVPAEFSKPVGDPTVSEHTAQLDHDYLEMAERGLKPILGIFGAPRWAGSFHKCEEELLVALDTKRCPYGWRTRAGRFYVALDRLDQMRAFARALALRYPSAVFEGPNEPDLHQAQVNTFHPGPEYVAEGQCAIYQGVKAAGPGRVVLSSGMTGAYWDFHRRYLAQFGNRSCFDHYNFHLYQPVGTQRSGPMSSFQWQLDEVRSVLSAAGEPKNFWITETGISSSSWYTQNKDEQTGEPRAAIAFQDWVTRLMEAPDIGGVILHALRDDPFGHAGGDPTRYEYGFGALGLDVQTKNTFGITLPRYCWMVLMAGNSDARCAGLSLPPRTARAPGFVDPPVLGTTDSGGRYRTGALLHAHFYELGEPAPAVTIQWRSCDILMVACKVVGGNRETYYPPSGDRFRKVQAIITLTNASGTKVSGTPAQLMW